jgi:enoyl-CoA hydratase/carnithine racemase
VGHIVLCNPSLNLLNVEFYEQLRDAVLSATADDLRAVLVRAEGPNFCGGGDAPVLNSLDTGGFRLLMAEFNRSFRALEALPVPTVAAVRGHVFGGGVELVLSCDFIVAAADATFRQIEVSVGNMPMAGGVQRMALLPGGAPDPQGVVGWRRPRRRRGDARRRVLAARGDRRRAGTRGREERLSPRSTQPIGWAA